jgi:hypothetical protein
VPTVPLIALKPHPYDGVVRRKGHRYEALSENDALVLTAAGLAKQADPTPVASLPTITAPPAPQVDDTVTDEADLVASDLPAAAEEATAPAAPQPEPKAEAKPRRRYERKDLVSEE